MSKAFVTASAIAAALLVNTTACSVSSPAQRRSTLVVSGAGFAAGTGLVGAAQLDSNRDRATAMFWTGIGLAVVSAVVLGDTAGQHPEATEVPVARAPITGRVQVPGLTAVELR